MIYDCGHAGCDICGRRTCSGEQLRRFGEYRVCDSCVQFSIKTVVRLAEQLGGTVIDVAKVCGYEKEPKP